VLKRQQPGYLTVDHRASPGIPEDVARALGYDPKLCGEGKFYEADTLKCAHCHGVVVKNPLRTRERNYCLKCAGHYICDGCAYLASLPDYVHKTFVEVIDETITEALKTDINNALGSPPKLLLP
jgi:hypothetical protein